MTDTNEKWSKPSNIIAIAQAITAVCSLFAASYISWSAWQMTEASAKADMQRLIQDKALSLRSELSSLLRQSYENEVVADAMVNLAAVFADLLEYESVDESAADFRLGASLGYLRYVQGNDVLLRQATALLDELRKTIDIGKTLEIENLPEVLPVDYLALAHGYYNSGDMHLARRYAEEAISVANSLTVKLQIESLLAVIKYTVGGNGRDHFQVTEKLIEEAAKEPPTRDSNLLQEDLPKISITEKNSLLAAIQAVRAAAEYRAGDRPDLDTKSQARRDIEEAYQRIHKTPDLELPRIVVLMKKALDHKLSKSSQNYPLTAELRRILEGSGIMALPNFTSLEDFKAWLKSHRKAKEILKRNGWLEDGRFEMQDSSGDSASEQQAIELGNPNEAAPEAPPAPEADPNA